jgi:hypothetical protein
MSFWEDLFCFSNSYFFAFLFVPLPGIIWEFSAQRQHGMEWTALLSGSVALAWSLQSEWTDSQRSEYNCAFAFRSVSTHLQLHTSHLTIPLGAKVQKWHENGLYHCPKAVPCRPFPFTRTKAPVSACFHAFRGTSPASIRPSPSDPQVWSAHPAISPLARSRSALGPAPVAQWPGLLPWSPRLSLVSYCKNERTPNYLLVGPRINICPLSVFASGSCYADSLVTSKEPIIRQIFDGIL